MTTARHVISYVRGMTDRQMDGKLQDTLASAGLMGDAEEVIACLMESARFKGHIRKAAEVNLEDKRAELEAKRREVDAAEVALRRVSGGEA